MYREGFYVEVIDRENRCSDFVKCDSEESAIAEAKKHNHAIAYNWREYDDGLGNYERSFFTNWN